MTRIGTRNVEARKNDENARISGTPIEADCFVWGPFDGRQLTSVQSTLKNRGLLHKAEISDRFLPDRWIVYLGPYSNDIAVRAFVKQFRQQGYKNVRPILSGALSYGVEMKHLRLRSLLKPGSMAKKRRM